MTVAVGDTGCIIDCDTGNGDWSGQVKVFSYSNKWNQVGDAIQGAVSEDKFGYSVSISADGMTVAVGAIYNGDNGYAIGYVRVFTYSSTTNKWNLLGDTLVGASSNDVFGYSVATSADGMTVAVGAPHFIVDGESGGSVRIFAYSSTKNTWNPLGDTL